MGCATSKLDQLPAVSLCHDRCSFLEDALQQSYALADEHMAYMQSLKTLGLTLHHFFDQSLKSMSGDDCAVSTEKPPKQSSPLSSPDHSLSSSNSDSHIQFETDSEEEATGKDFRSFNQIHPNDFNHGILTSYSLPDRNYRHQNFEFNGSGWKTPPPPAPGSGAWDYLNFFDEIYERYELPYSTSKTVKNKEEAHGLEAQQLVKQIHGDEKTSANCKKEKREENSSGEAVPVKNGDAENKKKVDPEMEKVQKRTDLNKPKNQSGKESVSEITKELQVLFEKASESGNEVLKILDTGNFRYHRSTKRFHVITSNSLETVSLPSKEKISSVDNDEIVSSQNLSSTLRKLCVWEKKLYDEVKAEEKLRIIHAKKCRQMKSLDQKGADARRVDSKRTLIRALSTKMRVAIEVIDKIAITINRLMDEELWPQISELIHRLFEMWKVMLECHSCQSQKVMEAKCLDVIALNGRLNDAHFEVAIKLKFELQNWSHSFSRWIAAQRGYVKSLNGWLRRCLLYEPEETGNGVSPFSHGRCGAPPIFVIIYRWLEAMDRLSDKELFEAVHGLSMSINQVLEQHNADLQQRIIADKDMERKVKILEKEEQKMQKMMQARVKKMTLQAKEESSVLLPRDTTGRSDIRDATSFQYDLKQIFSAMEKLAILSRQAYEELHECIEEGMAIQDNPECPYHG
ncbi:nitrate regulatory gene2 protein-like isoform X2 [Durio zibethinus]|uniref:Nitrate regulatory gene2 protein-like isoform X2 n=1 Tax=Durio zibethinus TaxID=66656 RepID=A0A6P5ZBD9_DURZI|nr:nitrate regulatory gene2 protein-like isoform X2 [Durio zibethinus]